MTIVNVDNFKQREMHDDFYFYLKELYALHCRIDQEPTFNQIFVGGNWRKRVQNRISSIMLCKLKIP